MIPSRKRAFAAFVDLSEDRRTDSDEIDSSRIDIDVDVQGNDEDEEREEVEDEDELDVTDTMSGGFLPESRYFFSAFHSF